jgi:hypothetical protein
LCILDPVDEWMWSGSQVDDSDDDMPELEEQTGSKKATATKPSESDNISDDESDVELDTEGVVAPDNEPLQKASTCSSIYPRLSIGSGA